VTQVIVSPEAEIDLTELSERISDAAGDVVASNYVDRIVRTLDRLARVPRASGRPVPKLGEGLRCHPFGRFNLYLRYDEDADVLYLVRVLRGRRNIEPDMFNP
jgi:plasmid stabilization system protein ParE